MNSSINGKDIIEHDVISEIVSEMIVKTKPSDIIKNESEELTFN